MCFIPKDSVKIELVSSNSATIHLDGTDLSKIMDLDGGEGIIKIGENTYKPVMNEEDAPQVIHTMFYVSNIKWLFFASTSVCAAAYIVFFFAEKLCKYFKECQTPFSQEISIGLVRLAWSLIPVCVAGSTINSCVESIVTGQLDIDISIDLTTILLILRVFMLSYIFKYGAALQN